MTNCWYEDVNHTAFFINLFVALKQSGGTWILMADPYNSTEKFDEDADIIANKSKTKQVQHQTKMSSKKTAFAKQLFIISMIASKIKTLHTFWTFDIVLSMIAYKCYWKEKVQNSFKCCNWKNKLPLNYQHITFQHMKIENNKCELT